MKCWTLDIDADGVALALLDTPGKRVNTLGDDSIAELATIVDRVSSDETVKGLVLASAKTGNFCAGGDLPDLDRLVGPPPPAHVAETLEADFQRFSQGHAIFRKLETNGKPVACAIEGAALGGGAELALACHFRVGGGERVSLGFPESAIGLMPGGGATQRLPRIVGVQGALKLLLDAKPVDGAEAHKLKLLDELVPAGDAIGAAKRWILGGGDAVQPWDRKGAKIPGGAPYVGGVSDTIAATTAMSRKMMFGNYEAPKNILSAVYEGTLAPFDAALRIETRYFVKTLRSPQARAMVRSLFFSPRELTSGANRPEGVPKSTFTKVTVLGAGLMGAGIANVQAGVGIETVLIDRTQEAAEKGKAYSRKVTDKAVARGRMSQAAADELLAQIVPTTDYAEVAGSELVIEAVFEDRAVKAEVTRIAEARLSDSAIFASNTSTLPITGLATASARPENFIGLHFFSPVERMGLVEIIRGERTSDATLAAAFDYVAAIGKTPIVAKDSRGFYTSRTITKYLDEPCEMLMEGIAPAIIENIGRMTGMPMAPFALSDAIGLELPLHVRAQTKADLGEAFVRSTADDVLETMVREHGRLGRKNGKGFYDYSEDGRDKRLWPGLASVAPPRITDAFDPVLQRDLKNRLLYSMALEAAKCIEEGVITDPREADLGALMAFSFPSWTGGPISLIDQVGVTAFVAECDRLADRYGERLRPCAMLRQMSAAGRSFYDRKTAAAMPQAVIAA
jgi:3-hydroxyacyl-CoA dehydrogenase/enoyl-CoA hydratase/3-hydroxybutyryl-CoA epimerase